jgi:hypothetical protein
MSKHSIEMVFKIWNDDHGDRVEIGSDSDGLDLVEIRYVNENNKIDSRITLTKESLPFLKEAIERLIIFHGAK